MCTPKILYSLYAESVALDDHRASQSHFTKIWQQNYSNIKIVKQCRLGRCDICIYLGNEISSSFGVRRKRIQAKYQEHVKKNTDERIALQTLSNMCKLDPSVHLFLLSDWAAPMLLPWHCALPKKWFTIPKIKQHIFGIYNERYIYNIIFLLIFLVLVICYTFLIFLIGNTLQISTFRYCLSIFEI